jgi:hypothetical protein
MGKSMNWQVTVESAAGQSATATTTRIVYTPPGVAHGPTFAVQDMAFHPVPMPADGALKVCDGQVELQITPDGRPPHADNLRVRWRRKGAARTWQPGDLDHENLGAGFIALDNLWRDCIPQGVVPMDPLIGFDQYFWNTSALTLELEFAHQAKTGRFFEMDARSEEVRRLLRGQESAVFDTWPPRVRAALARVRHHPPGFFTRSGLTLFRDDTWPWNRERAWIEPKPDPQPIVLYLIHHDCAWKRLCAALVELLGPFAQLDDRFLGVWYSNYAPLGQKHFQELAADFAAHDLPLDIVSVDMDWHGKDWYGYQWNPEFFPDPPAYRAWLRDANLASTFNIHPLYIPQGDPRLEEFRQRSGNTNPVHGARGDWHPYQAGCVRVDIHTQADAEAYFDIFHAPIERDGCDFWWIDGSVRHADGRDECGWLNHAYRAHLAKQPDRLPIVLARAGGLGAHRDAILFSGDACSQWEVLAYEVEASVRGFGGLIAFMSHDIGGFYHDSADRDENKPPDDLFIRWVQFGCLSPIMRLHSFDGVREPWKFAPATLEICRRFMQLRMRLAGYVRGLLDTDLHKGVPPHRPMWLEYADEDAYACFGQYLLGPSLLVVPVVRPDGAVRYWLPPGTWHHAFAARRETGPRWIEETQARDAIPLWLRDGDTLELCPPAHRVEDALSGPRIRVEGSSWA